MSREKTVDWRPQGGETAEDYVERVGGWPGANMEVCQVLESEFRIPVHESKQLLLRSRSFQESCFREHLLGVLERGGSRCGAINYVRRKSAWTDREVSDFVAFWTVKVLVLFTLSLVFSTYSLASEYSSNRTVKYLGAAYFPIEGNGDPKGIIAAYLVKGLTISEESMHENTKLLSKIARSACESRKFGIFLDKKSDHVFTQLHIFLANAPPTHKESDSPALQHFGNDAKLDNFSFFERAFSVVDGKCGVRIETQTENDIFKYSIARYLYGGPS